MEAGDRLSMLDEFGGRRFIIPAEVLGRFRKWRNWVYFILMAIFLGLPWIKVGGHQALHFDIGQRRFVVFGSVFHAHEAPIIFYLLAISVLALALMTAIWGRVWCGWACPQTVFIDLVYRRIEQWVEGGYIERRKLYLGPMTATKFRKYSFKWFLYFVVSSLFAHSFIAYFSGANELLAMTQRPPEQNMTYFLLVTVTTAVLMFNFGWFREQFCIIMCPYGRIQSLLMDRSTINVMYDSDRGEPRKGSVPVGKTQGDCVNCLRCVQVCPTGIDIRKGIQMECIGCTACIDACDEIMTKVKKPLGLISYRPTVIRSHRRVRSRVVGYSALLGLMVIMFIWSVARREPYSALVLRAKDTPYQVLQGDLILNHFKAHLINQSGGTQIFRFELPPEAEKEGISLTTSAPQYTVASGQSTEVHVFVRFPKLRLAGKTEGQIPFLLKELGTASNREMNFSVVGP